MHRFRHSDCWNPWRPVIAGLMLANCLGCSKPAPGPVDPVSTQPAPENPLDHAAPVPNSPGGDSAALSSDDPRSRTKWIGDIPYDVFFEDPLSVAAEEHVTAPSAPGVRVSPPVSQELRPPADPPDRPEPGTAHDPASAPSVTSSAVDWARLADIEVLNEETKQLRNRLSTNLRTVATYNQNVDAIANDAVILAAIAAVVDVHPGSLSWQEKADAVRDLATQMAAHAGETGRQAFSATQVPYEQLIGVLDGGPPPHGGAADDRPFSDVAGRSDLMQRIKRSFEWLKSEINTEARFRESQEQIVREASLVAVLGGLISTDSYDLSDESQYQRFVRELIDGNVDMATAVADENYQDFTTARDRVQNSCAACHGEYALGDEGL